MASLFKFIFYLVIIVFWVLNNVKKKKNWDSDLSSQPKRPYIPLKKPVREHASRAPAREGLFDENIQTDALPDVALMSYDQILEMRRLKAKDIKSRRIKEKPAPAVASAPELKAADMAPVSAVPILKEKIKKPSLALKSSVKEGIMWSIILGPPRSKVPFTTKGSPIARQI